MKTSILEYKQAVRSAAEHVARVLAEKPEAVLALSTGRSTAPLFEELCRMCRAGELSLSGARIFAVTEYIGQPAEKSCRRAIEDALIGQSDARAENCFFLSPDTLAAYDDTIAAAGGIDLVVLGLGPNAHIGYNEPAVPFDSLSHVQKLTDSSRRHLAGAFGGEENTPEQALTMGIKTIVSARDIIVLAFGQEKAEPVFKMLYGRTDSSIPAAFLQIPLSVTVYLDQAAAQKL